MDYQSDTGKKRIAAFWKLMEEAGVLGPGGWDRYREEHDWGNKWEDISEEQFQAALEWGERVKSNPELRKLREAMDLPLGPSAPF